jgi:hypothetical protein
MKFADGLLAPGTRRDRNPSSQRCEAASGATLPGSPSAEVIAAIGPTIMSGSYPPRVMSYLRKKR